MREYIINYTYQSADRYITADRLGLHYNNIILYKVFMSSSVPTYV